MGKLDLSDYVTVAERLVAFRKKYPDGRMTSEIVETGHEDYIAVKAMCFRTPEDVTPGVGLAWEPVPGPTPFTKNSELQNAETSAWGRALVAALVAETSKGIASKDEIREPVEQPVREDVKPSPSAWIDIAVSQFGLWTPEEKNAAYKAAMTGLSYDRLSSLKRAENVVARMSESYYSVHPEASPF